MPTIIRIYFLALALNIFWETAHSFLYKTCLKMNSFRFIFRILRASLGDAFEVTFFYFIIFLNQNPFLNRGRLILFGLVCLATSYAWERITLNRGLRVYSKKMPLILSVGLTPLWQLLITSLITFYLVF